MECFVGCCCQLQPEHTQQASTIVFDSGICYCGPNPRLAKGDPLVCSRADYDKVAAVAADVGMTKRLCCEANCCGTPCCGHGWPLDIYTQSLNEAFPHLSISVVDRYVGCDDQGHWEFVLHIRQQGSRSMAQPVMQQTITRDNVTGAVVKSVTTKTVTNPDGSLTVTKTVTETTPTAGTN